MKSDKKSIVAYALSYLEAHMHDDEFVSVDLEMENDEIATEIEALMQEALADE